MNKSKTGHRPARWHDVAQHIPTLAHIGELLIGLIVLAAVQNFWLLSVGASADITPPSVPNNLVVTGRSATEIDISWSASTDDVGVIGYHVYRDGSQVGTISGLNYNDVGLSPNTSYVYTVTAYDAAANESASSSGLTAATLADTLAPSVPGNLHQTGQTTNSISIAWDISNDNVSVTGYDIYRNGALVRSQPGTTYTDTGLAVYTGYTYNIAAHDGANNASTLSASLNAGTAPDTTPPSVPDNLTMISNTVSSVTIGWNAATDNVGVSGYHVYRDGNLIASTGGTNYTDTGLSVSSGYTYTVSAYDLANNASAQSAPYATTSSNDTTAPTIPSNVHSASLQDTSISFTWNASTDDVAVMGYKVYRDGSLIGTTTSLSYTDTGLTPVTQYGYTLKAYDAAGNESSASTELKPTTAYDTTAPTVPANLKSIAATDTSINLSWDSATDNVAVTGYDLYRGSTIITSTTGTSFTDTGLSVNTGYTYRIRSHDASGNNSLLSPTLSATTIPDTIAPTAPSALASPVQTTTSVDLAWNAAADDASPAADITYNLYRNGAFVISQSGLNYRDIQLRYDTTYHYSVTATDAAGNQSMVSNLLSVSTLADTTSPTVSLSAPLGGQTVALTFPVSATASDDLELSHVDFYVDNVLINTLTASPFSFNWNSYAVHNGAHTLIAKAYDASGNFASQSLFLTVTNPPPSLVGDLNGDHRVNLFDLSILLAHFNKAGAGDFNNNGKVDIFDLSVLLSHYGSDNTNYN